MIIQKVINNNVVSTFDMNNHEVILMGKGIGFRKKAGDELDKTKIEKIFTLDQREKSPFIQEVLAIIQEFQYRAAGLSKIYYASGISGKQH